LFKVVNELKKCEIAEGIPLAAQKKIRRREKMKREIFAKMKTAFQKLFSKKEEKKHSEKYMKTIAFLNRFSLLFHMLISCAIVFGVELVSRRGFTSACEFVDLHTMAFLYNAFIVFCSLTIVYLFRRRAFLRFIIAGFWMFLGIVNGCVLSNRVTPFGYTDLKCLPELFAMSNNTNYFTSSQISQVIFGVSAFFFVCLILFIKGPKYQGKIHMVIMPTAVCLLVLIGLPVTTHAAQNSKVVADYFANIAQGYENYGFIYGFSCSVMDRGMSKPKDYSEETIKHIQDQVDEKKKTTKIKKKKQPNIICVLLESFCDPREIKFLKTNKDPIPTFHELEKKYTSGYCEVPVVGAGTANTEFEVLTGMSIDYFGTGEYPYKTILKKKSCESVAADLSGIGYGTHVVHNNGGNFYSRANAFSKMGFDTFTSKEMMNITQYTPNGSWATDDILVKETTKAMDYTPNQADFTYIITVGSHGDYPKEPVIQDPTYTIEGMEDVAKKNQWTYYVNQLNEVDTFMKNLIKEMSKRDEDTIIVFFGDHLPTMGLENKDMVSNDIYKTKYVTWNNMGLKKKDVDLASYQLMASVTNNMGIHEGTILNYHQTHAKSKNQKAYLDGLEDLQYDILYGKRYCYDGLDKYPATNLEMGVEDVVIDKVDDNVAGNRVVLCGSNFTKWSKIYINGKRVGTNYVSGNMLTTKKDNVKDGDEIVVNQLGSGETIFRSSNTVVYENPDADVVDTPDATE